jgi:hypothetical protein
MEELAGAAVMPLSAAAVVYTDEVSITIANTKTNSFAPLFMLLTFHRLEFVLL